ncbi:16S rRNA (cytosine(1402)-N(4))-methyltransferase RsmH, partial [Candidatus Dojkabacteria bacterium]|nr:16S rRNA (cytosine(1402)-N(4))-methyltransferase RsmH [Candidatus Dojkabacteria bacterium]
PVFNNEIIDYLDIKPSGCYVDLTLGGGGHSSKILSGLSGGTLVAFDLDKQALQNYASTLAGQVNEDGKILSVQIENNKVYLVNDNFANLEQVLQSLNLSQVDAIIADLGWSTEQLARVPGLSFKNPEAKLDMRFTAQSQVTAADLLGGLHAGELAKLFMQNADLSPAEAKKLSQAVEGFREKKKIETTGDLLQIIDSAFATAINTHKYDGRKRFSGGKIVRNMPARVFQALRIAVNFELSTLQSMLEQSLSTLSAGGLLQVITFHSAEDRLVAQYFRGLISAAKAENLYSQDFLLPSVAELSQNLRARSARLRGIKKL